MPSFGLSGGSDTHLFAELYDAGRRIAWCDRAQVYEAIPASRVDTSWLLRREYRRGQTLSRSFRRRDPRVLRYLRRLANAAIQMVSGLVVFIVGLPFGRARWFHGAKMIVFGAGMVTGLVSSGGTRSTVESTGTETLTSRLEAATAGAQPLCRHETDLRIRHHGW